MKLLIMLSVVFASYSTYASTKIFCGTRSGTAGNAYLVGQSGLELAIQGGDQTLLEQTDSLIAALGPDASGESGTQNGSRYCVKAEVKTNKVTKITAAWRMGDEVRTFCGVRSGTAGNAYLEGKNGLELAVQGGDQFLLEQADSLIAALGPDASGESGTQNGSRYCVNAALNYGEVTKIISAFRE